MKRLADRREQIKIDVRTHTLWKTATSGAFMFLSYEESVCVMPMFSFLATGTLIKGLLYKLE